ncbi:hypothetical protein CA51_13240 [Rosistilla oblonga]|uniref:hypothetical protein n=1 Tax=Rosistilla oblonga TaxID=2527990 RepID=UPI00118C9EF1|nr:hypothetical protein [Rosistilla oblonga]QDV11460.1 hypothetical protein CA51_13240 [Rosistilla oblonga]
MENDPADQPRDSRLTSLRRLPWFSYAILSFGILGMVWAISLFGVFGPVLGPFPSVVVSIAMMAMLISALFAFSARVLNYVLPTRVEPDASPKLRRIGGALAVGFILVAAVGVVFSAARDISNKQQQEWQAIQVTSDGFVVQCPKSFEAENSSPLAPGAIQMLDTPRDLLFVMAVSPRKDVAAQILREHAENLAAVFHAEVPDATASELLVTSINGHPLTRQKFTYAAGPSNIDVLVECHEFPEHIVEARYLSTPSRLEGWMPEVDEISSSIYQTATE